MAPLCVWATWSALVTNEGANQSFPLAIDSWTSYGIWDPRSALSENAPRELNPHERSCATVDVAQAAVFGKSLATVWQYGQTPVTWSVPEPSGDTVSIPDA